jgi:hypothetical protein
MTLFILTSLFDFLGGIIGLTKRKSIKNKGLRFFPIFLLIQFCNQFFTSSIVHFGRNTHMYNIFMVFDMTCFAFLFYHLLEKENFKKVVVILTTVFYVFYLIDRFYLQADVGVYLSYSRSFLGFNLIVFSLLYFFNLFDFTKPEENLTRKADFWIVIGIFFFYLTSTIILSALNFIIQNPETQKYYSPDTMKYLAITLYSFYIVGFLCHKPQIQ